MDVKQTFVALRRRKQKQRMKEKTILFSLSVDLLDQQHNPIVQHSARKIRKVYFLPSKKGGMTNSSVCCHLG